MVLARVEALSRTLEEASLDLGASRWQTYRFVILPALAPAIISGVLFCFTLSLDDFVITLFTASPEVTTLPLKVYSMVKLPAPDSEPLGAVAGGMRLFVPGYLIRQSMPPFPCGLMRMALIPNRVGAAVIVYGKMALTTDWKFVRPGPLKDDSIETEFNIAVHFRIGDAEIPPFAPVLAPTILDNKILPPIIPTDNQDAMTTGKFAGGMGIHPTLIIEEIIVDIKTNRDRGLSNGGLEILHGRVHGCPGIDSTQILLPALAGTRNRFIIRPVGHTLFRNGAGFLEIFSRC